MNSPFVSVNPQTKYPHSNSSDKVYQMSKKHTTPWEGYVLFVVRIPFVCSGMSRN